MLLNHVENLTKTVSNLQEKVDDVHSQMAISKADHRSPILETQRHDLPSSPSREPP